jgi:hypothetical protein
MGHSMKTIGKSELLTQRADLKKELLVLEEQALRSKNLQKKIKNLESILSKLE